MIFIMLSAFKFKQLNSEQPLFVQVVSPQNTVIVTVGALKVRRAFDQ